jgi:hypothetical protein
VEEKESLAEFERWAKKKANFYEWQMRSGDSGSMEEIVGKIEEFRRIVRGIEPPDESIHEGCGCKKTIYHDTKREIKEMEEWEKKGSPYTISKVYDDI